jgi:serine/threonine protein phosphatase PrpC
VSEPAGLRGEQDGYPLNVDHSATSESERNRIMADAIVKGVRFLYDGYATVGPAKDIYSHDIESGEIIKDPKGVYHNTVRGEWASYLKRPSGVQLAVTRTFGDFGMQPYGVTSLPTTEIWPLPQPGETLSIVIASDGFWDCVHYEAVGDLVRRPDLLGNAEAAAEVLMDYGLAKGKESFGSSSDNIAVMVLYFKG